MYEFVRVTLGIRMHGIENLHEWEAGAGMEQASIGEDISLIHEVRFLLLITFFDGLADWRVFLFLGYP